jgi:hypothetical protein
VVSEADSGRWITQVASTGNPLVKKEKYKAPWVCFVFLPNSPVYGPTLFNLYTILIKKDNLIPHGTT